MRIGVAKEIKPQEYRVALTPAGARELVRRGHEVVVETGAGVGSQFDDAAYESTGARIASVDEVWETAELLLKVKEPIAIEYPRLRDGPRALHVPAHRRRRTAHARTRRQRRHGRRVRDRRDRRPPAAAAGADERGRGPARRRRRARTISRSPKGGRGLLLGGVAGVAPGKVVVIGGGIVGYNAAVIALGLGAQVTILDRSVDRMRHLEEMLHGRVSLVMSSTLQIEESVSDADMVIGAVLIPGALAPKLLTREMVAGMKDRQRLLRRRDRPGRLLRDVTRDDARRSRLRGRRRRPLLRREHARRGADHVDEGAHERDAALRRGDRRQRAGAAVARDQALARGRQRASTAGSPTRPWPRRTGWSYTPLEDVLASPSSRPSAALLACFELLLALATG